MILSLLLSGGDPLEILLVLLFTVPIMLLALSFHEMAHGYVAWKFGDNTAKNLGRLSLNPIRHLDPIGLVSLLVFGYGWAKAVPINTRNFKNAKWGMALTALAGPLSNLLLGAVSALLAGTFGAVASYLYYTASGSFWFTFTDLLTSACYYGALINFVYMTFNMIPVPPFDGSRVAFVFLPPRTYFAVMRYERQIMFGTLIAIMALNYLGFSPFSFVAERLTDLIYAPVAKGVLRALIS